ncbi:MAG: nickel-dependent lactate racemase [Anaerolineae bacterium]|nr:nickel-dependent lactate racemase [Anaerolineae bacterium]
MEISLPYGNSRLAFSVPSERVAWVLEASDRPGVPDVTEALRQALASPIGSPPLADLARGVRGEVVILVDDGTRATPQSVLLPVVLDELNRAGIADERIVLLIALGTHRPMTVEEQRSHLGPEVLSRVRVENLDAHNPSAFVDLGTTPSGVPIEVARRLCEAGLSLSVGNIVPHMYTGFSGGAKMVQPGACSARTTARTHLLAAPLVHCILGVAENPVRAELDAIGRRARLGFIVNTVLNRHKQVVGIVAGDMVAAHRKGVALASEVYGVRVPEQPDIIVAGAHPADRDFWQGAKPLNTAAIAVRPGGELILVIAAPEGIAPDHPYLKEAGGLPAAEVEEAVRNGTCPDEVAAAACIAYDLSRRKARVTFVSDGISADDARCLGAGHAQTVEEALDGAFSRLGREARVGIMPEAAELLPIL